MFAETIQLETLRQKIEDVEYEAGSQSDYLDYGKPSPEKAKQVKELLVQLENQSKALKEELKLLIARVRAQQPQAIDEWINVHASFLQKIIEEEATDRDAPVRKNVAKGTLQQWEKVRVGEIEYININWHFLKDYKANVRTAFRGDAQKGPGNQAWWQFWKRTSS